MKIKKKISFQFITIVAVLMLISFILVYYLFSSVRKEGFYTRLSDKIQIFQDVESVSPSSLKEFYSNVSISLPHEIISVYNSRNELVYTTKTTDDIQFSKSILETINTKGEGNFRINNFEIIGAKFNNGREDYIVIVSAKDIYGLRKLQKLRIILLLVFLIKFLVIYFFGRFFAAKSLKPISNIIRQVNNINVENINSRLHVGNANDEVTHLAITFNKLLERIENSITIQKDFITNSSHELRNPLAAITGQLEVALLQERTNEEYRESLQSVLEDIKKLNQLANRLLLLSRATNDLTTESFTPVRIDDVLWEARAEVLKNHKSYEVLFHFDKSIKEEHHFMINGNWQLLKTAFFNLIDNGCKYSVNHKVEVDLSVEDERLKMVFKDDGIGIPEDEIEYIFEPFYRAKNVRKNRGHGIGLSLVDKILKLHRGKINVDSSLNKGTVFHVELPLNG